MSGARAAAIATTSARARPELFCGLRCRKGPCAVQDLGLRAIEAHEIVPWRGNGKAIGDCAVAAAKLNGERSVVGRLRNKVIERIGVLRIGDEMALVGVDPDRPEAVDRHVLDAELVDRLAVVMSRRDVQIKGV